MRDTMPDAIPCQVGYRAAWDTLPCGIPCRAGYHAVRDTMPGGIPCRMGYRAAWDTMLSGIPDTTREGYRAVSCAGRCGVGARARLHRCGAAHHHAVGRQREPRVLRLCRRARCACVRACAHVCVRESIRACVRVGVRSRPRACVRVRACAPASVRMNACARPCACRCGRVPASAHVGVYAPVSALAHKYARARRKRAGGRATTAQVRVLASMPLRA